MQGVVKKKHKHEVNAARLSTTTTTTRSQRGSDEHATTDIISIVQKRRKGSNDGNRAAPRILGEEEEGAITTSPLPLVLSRDLEPFRRPPFPILLEDAEYEDDAPPHPALMVRPTAQQPATDAVQFYAATQNQGIPHFLVHQALRESHEWHRKYNEGAIISAPAAALLIAAADRQAGAKNPSPSPEEEEAVVVEKKPRSIRTRRQRRMNMNNNNDVPETVSFRPTTTTTTRKSARSIVLRPVALRITRPIAVRAPAMFYTGDTVPKHMVQSRPMTAADVASSSSSSHSVYSATSSRIGSEKDVSSPPPTTAPAAAAAKVVHVIPDHHDDEAHRNVVERRHPMYYDAAVQAARDGILQALASTGGETDSANFQSSLKILTTEHNHHGDFAMEGTWLALTKPTFFECLGDNDQGDPMYSLGRMSFDMFSPTKLICSLQGNFNQIERVVDDQRRRATVPKALHDQVQDLSTVLRTYNIITAFTIEPGSPAYPDIPNKDVHRPIRGIMTTIGYIVADPDTPNRQSVWITGGRIEPNDSEIDIAEWKRLFALHPPSHGMAEQARLLAVKLLVGAVLPESMDPETGAMEYSFTRPLGGHGVAYIDTLFADDSLRIVRSHRGTIFVFTRTTRASA